jgi:beta-N-acetylhexosaminidase
MAIFNLPCSLSSAGKAYQVIISRIDGLKVSDPAYRRHQLALVQKGIGGFIIFGGRREEIKDFIAEAQSRAVIRLFIASDIERGVGQQIEGMTPFPSQMAFAAAVAYATGDDPDIFEKSLGAIAAEAAEIGINMALTPVLDININPDNPIICTRAWSDDPEIVSRMGKRCIESFERQGILSCGKHFPGHGDTSIDSHITLPVIRKSASELHAHDLLPFREAIGAGVSAIMIGHLCMPALDTRPASLSARIVTGLLRQEMGFEGLILTDALNMHALKEFGDAGLECLKAGADILLHPEDADATASALLLALEQKKLKQDILDTAVDRILKRKAILRQDTNRISPIAIHSDLSKQISQKSITLVKNRPGLLPLNISDKTALYFSGDSKYFGTSILSDNFTVAECGRNELSDTVVIAIFTSVAAWHGSSGISEEERRKLESVMKTFRHSIIISFGSPYVLRYFDSADMLIAAYDPTIQAQQAVINCLGGRSVFSGILPVHMPKESSHQ